MSSDAARAGSELPDLDDHLVEPNTRYEMLDGELAHVSPADPPHGELHVQLAALIEAHTSTAFEGGIALMPNRPPSGAAPRTFKRRFGGGGRGRLASADGAGYPEARRV